MPTPASASNENRLLLLCAAPAAAFLAAFWLLPAIRLVAPVEQAVEQLGVFTEHVPVEAGRNVLDVRAHHGKGGLDDGIRGV